MKRFFITGLITLLPITLTILIVTFIFNLLTEPFINVLQRILEVLGLFQQESFVSKHAQLIKFISRLVILALLFFTTVLLGFIARWFFIHYLIRAGEVILHQIPFINSIYKTSKDVIQTIFTSDTKAFKQVVLVPFPNPDSLSIGLLTLETVPGLPDSSGKERAAVFVPTTPNPTSGFFMLFNKEDIKYLDMKIDDALKYVISCGVIEANFYKKHPPEGEST